MPWFDPRHATVGRVSRGRGGAPSAPSPRAQFTEELQLRALSDLGLPRSPAGLGLLRCAPALCPPAACGGGGGGGCGGGGGLFQPHYRRYNRSRAGGLREGDPAPVDCPLFTPDGVRTRLRPAAGRRLTVLVAGSYT